MTSWVVAGKQLTGAQRWATGVTTEGVERRGVLRGGGGGGATGDLNVKSNGVWVGGRGRTEGENVPTA